MKLRNLSLVLVLCARLAFGQTSGPSTATVTLNTTTKKTQPPIGVLILDGAANLMITRGTGSPEGIVTAAVGSLYLDLTGQAWQKTSGTGSTGWSIFGGSQLPPMLTHADQFLSNDGVVTARWTQAVADYFFDPSNPNIRFYVDISALTPGVYRTATAPASGNSTWVVPATAGGSLYARGINVDGTLNIGPLGATIQAPLSSDVDDYTLPDSTGFFQYWRAAGAARTVNGLACGQAPGQALRVFNFGSTYNLIFKHQSTTSQPENLFYNDTHTDIICGPDQHVDLVYDGILSNWRVSLAAAAGGSGTVTNVATTSPITGGPITTTGTIGFDKTVNLGMTNSQTSTLTNGTTNSVDTIQTLNHDSSGAPANSFGGQITFGLESTTTNDREAGDIGVVWQDVTDATRTAYMDFRLVNSASVGSKMRLFPSGGLAVNGTTDPGAGIISAATGYKIAGGEFPISGNGLVKRTGANTYAQAVAGSDYLNGVTAPITNTSGSVGLNTGVDLAFTAAQTLKLTNATTNSVDTLFTFSHDSSGTPANGLGGQVQFGLESTTTNDREAGDIGVVWQDVTDATRTAYMDFRLVNSASVGSKMRLFPSGGLALNGTTDPGAGIFSAATGYKIAGGEFPLTTNGIPKRTGANTYVPAVAGTDYLSAVASPITNTGGTVGLNVGVDHAFTVRQTFTFQNADTNVPYDVVFLTHNTTAAPAAGFGTGLGFTAQTTTTPGQTEGTIRYVWTDPTDATKTAAIEFAMMNGGSLSLRPVKFWADGAVSVGYTTPTDPTAGYVDAATGYKVGGTDIGSTTQTLTNKRINPRENNTASSASITINSDTTDQYDVTALAVGTTFNAPSGTPVQGQKLIIRIKDNATAQTLAFTTGSAGAFRFSSDLAAPTTTIISKTLYMGFIYNLTDSRWDCVALLNNF